MADLPADKLAALRQRFIDRLASDRPRIAAAQGEPVLTDEIRDIVHRIAGIAGSLGYPHLSAIALEIERALDRQDAGTPEPARLDDLVAVIDEVISTR